jgi:Family of unknown function (DUF6640)
MTRPVAARGGRLLGRGLLTLANVITAAAPVAADWNDSHVFNERWPAHARFPRRDRAGDGGNAVVCQHLVHLVRRERPADGPVLCGGGSGGLLGALLPGPHGSWDCGR